MGTGKATCPEIKSITDLTFNQVKVADHGEYVHLRIFENLPCYGGGVYLHGVLHHHQVGDQQVDYFDQNMNFDQPQWDD